MSAIHNEVVSEDDFLGQLEYDEIRVNPTYKQADLCLSRKLYWRARRAKAHFKLVMFLRVALEEAGFALDLNTQGED